MIYICIPTHNEQQTVGVVLWKLRQVLTDFPRDYQLLVVDDASTDKTPDVLEPYTRVLPLTVIRSERRLGYAGGLELLLREAVRRSEYPKRDVIVAMQADFSDEPDDVVALVKRLEAGADVAVGNKVSTARDTRMRRFSRVVAQFFARRVKWPEGVETPFDGYRAYRLYAVKKAMEERPGRRLVRYDGWAGHAELLRAVLPFARRVDVVNVDDRADRLQRPRREKPFAAAMQVRGLGSALEPEGLVGVEELDRIAATASRSRERAALSVRVGENGRNARNGGRTRTRQERPAARARGAGGQERTSARAETERSPRRRERPRDAERSARGGRPERTTPATRRQQESGRAQLPAEEPTLEMAPDATTLPVAAVDPDVEQNGTPPAADSKPKRKRRRRRRTSGRAGGGTAVETPNDTAAGADSAEPPTESGVEAAGTDVVNAEGEVQRKRRRRGGRRGGRGRRKPPSAEAGSGEGPPEFMPDTAPESPAHVESD